MKLVVSLCSAALGCHIYAYTYEDCRTICQLTPGCEFWDFETTTLGCWTKMATGWTMRARDINISGDKAGNVLWEGYELYKGDTSCF